MRICAIIPAYNEAAEIGTVVSRVRAKGIDAVVIDDGSSDESGAIAREHGAVVIVHQEKRGKGRSLRHGFDYALAQGYEGVVTLDGDGQHDVDDIDVFLARAAANNACVIVGTRMRNPAGMPLLRFLVNKTMSSLISASCGQVIPDTQCGYRFIGTNVLRAIALSSSDFEIESEVLVQSSRQGFSIHSVPIKTIYRNESSKIDPLFDTIRFFIFMGRVLCAGKANARQRHIRKPH